MAELTEPSTLYYIQKRLKEKGYSDKAINDALGRRIDIGRASEAVGAGYITPKEAIGEAGLGVVPKLKGFEVEPELGTEEKKTKVYREDLLSKVKDIQGFMQVNKGKNLVGPETQLFRGIREKFGFVSSESVELRSKLSELAANIAFGIGGKQLTPKEMEVLQPSIPQAGDSEKVVASKLTALENNLNRMLGVEKTTGEISPNLFEPKKKEEPFKGFFGEQKEPAKPLDIQAIGKRVSEAAPVAGAVVGGMAGALLGAGVGSLFTGAVGTAIGAGAGIAFGETLQDLLGIQDETPPEQIKKAVVYPATAAALDLATAGLFMGGSKVIKVLGSKIFNLGDDLALRAIRPSPSQQKNFFKRTGIKLKEFVVEKGLFKKGTEQVDELIAPLQKSFDDIAVRSGKQVEIKAISGAFDDKIAQFSDIPTKKAQQIAKKLAGEKDLFLKKYADKIAIDVGDITNLRRTIDELVSTSKWIQDPVSAGSERAVREIYQDVVRKTTEELADTAGRSLKGIGQELRNLYEFRDIALMQEGLGKGTLPFGLIRTISTTIGGGAGYAYGRSPQSAIEGALIGYGATWAMNNPKIISYIARNLVTIGRGLEGIPDKQKAKILTDAFRRLLTNLAAMKMTHFGYEEEVPAGEGLFVQ